MEVVGLGTAILCCEHQTPRMGLPSCLSSHPARLSFPSAHRTWVGSLVGPDISHMKSVAPVRPLRQGCHERWATQASIGSRQPWARRPRSLFAPEAPDRLTMRGAVRVGCRLHGPATTQPLPRPATWRPLPQREAQATRRPGTRRARRGCGCSGPPRSATRSRAVRGRPAAPLRGGSARAPSLVGRPSLGI